MPVKHDLFQDLGFAKDDLKRFEKNDPHLTALIAKYTAADKEVVEAEANDGIGVTDQKLLKLKEARLKIKDQIASLVSSHAQR